MKKVRPIPARIAGVVLVASALLSGCFDQSAQQLLESGKALLDKKEANAAAIQFKSALQKDPGLIEARFYLGVSLLEAGDVAGAMIEIDKAAEQRFNEERLIPLRAAALMARGQADKVIGDYAQVDLKDPKRDSELKAALASAYGFKGLPEQARKAADRALALDPASVDAQMIDIRLKASARDFEGAMNGVEAVLKANPKSSGAWMLKGELLQAMRRGADEQLVALRESVKLWPGNLMAHGAIINVLVQQKDLDAASKQVEMLRKQASNHPHTRYYSALVALERMELKQANEQVQALLKMTPDNPRALQLAGLIDMQRGAYLQATANFNKALTNTPRNPMALRVLLARAYLRTSDANKALATLQPVLDAPGAPAEAFSAAAEAYVQQGKAKQAQELFAKAVKLNPADAQGRTALALAQLGAGKIEQGLEDLRAISATDTGGSADLALFNAHMVKGEYAKAIAALDVLERKQPNKPLAPTLLGRLELQRGNTAKARESFETALKRSPGYIPAAQVLAGMDVQDKKIDQAIQRFERILAADPSQLDARMAIIGLKSQAGASREEVIALIEAAVKAHPAEPTPRLLLIGARLDGGQAKQALATAQEAMAAIPDHPGLYEALGRAQFAAGDANQAIQAFNQMAKLLPNSPQPAVRLAELYVARRDAPNAIVQLRRALTIKPDHGPAQFLLVGLLVGTGKVGEARAIAQQAKTLKPDDPAGWAFEGDIEALNKNYPAAIEAYKVSLKKRESSEVAIRLHRAYAAANKLDELNKLEVSYLAAHPTDAAFLFETADSAMRMGDHGRAEKRYAELLKLQPNNGNALNNLAWLMQKAGKKEALDYAERALKAMPDAPPFLDTLAGIHAEAGRYEKAVELQRRAVTLDPKQHMHRLHLAQYYAAAGRKADARGELGRLAELGGSFPRQDEVRKLLSSL